MQRVLDITEEAKVETLTRIVDRVHEICPGTGQIVAVSAERTVTDSERQNRVLDTVEDRLNQMQAQINVLSFDSRYRPRPRSSHVKSTLGL